MTANPTRVLDREEMAHLQPGQPTVPAGHGDLRAADGQM